MVIHLPCPSELLINSNLIEELFVELEQERRQPKLT